MKKINKVDKALSIKELMSLKIIKETPVGCVKLDVEMSPALQQFLVRHAEQNMKKEDKERLLIEWAFVNILTKRIKEIQTEPSRYSSPGTWSGDSSPGFGYSGYSGPEHPVVKRILNKIRTKIRI